MDKMIQKLVQKTIDRFYEAYDTFLGFDRDFIPVELRLNYYSAEEPTYRTMLDLLRAMAYGTLEENKARTAKLLQNLEYYIIAVENIQIAFELGTMSEEEIKAEAKNVEREWRECNEGAKGLCNVKDEYLRIYLRMMYNRRVTLVAYPLNMLIEEQKFRAAEERIRRVQYGFKFAKMLIHQVL